VGNSGIGKRTRRLSFFCRAATVSGKEGTAAAATSCSNALYRFSGNIVLSVQVEMVVEKKTKESHHFSSRNPTEIAVSSVGISLTDNPFIHTLSRFLIHRLKRVN